MARNVSKDKMMRELQEVSFSMDEVRLFLDTHPEDGKAMEYYEKLTKRRQMLMDECSRAYGPLTPDYVLPKEDGAWEDDSWRDGDRDSMPSMDDWGWVDDPWPWEGEQ